LCIDPFSGDSLGPGPIREAIEFALAHGWAPDAKAKPMKLQFRNNNFVLITDTTESPSAAMPLRETFDAAKPHQNQPEGRTA
jgi:hypothetical protein